MVQILKSEKRGWTSSEITDRIYPELEKKLKAPAKSNTEKVLTTLMDQGLVEMNGSEWKFINSNM